MLRKLTTRNMSLHRVGYVIAAIGIAGVVVTFYLRAAAERERPKREALSTPKTVKKTKSSTLPMANVNEIARQLAVELEQPEAPLWAGHYYSGDGLGDNYLLIIAPKSGFVVNWSDDEMLKWQNYGLVTTSPDYGQFTASPAGLRLTFALPNPPKNYRGFPEQLIPVRWGSRSYLIALGDMRRFCVDCDSGFEPRSDLHGMYLLRDGGYKLAVSGLPDVPPAYRKYLLAKPIVARIASVGSHKVVDDWAWHRKTKLTINAGTLDGVQPGMLFWVRARDERYMVSAEVTSVTDAHSSIATLIQDQKGDVMPRRGWKLSTREISEPCPCRD